VKPPANRMIAPAMTARMLATRLDASVPIGVGQVK
jgi:hypothetical protein